MEVYLYFIVGEEGTMDAFHFQRTNFQWVCFVLFFIFPSSFLFFFKRCFLEILPVGEKEGVETLKGHFAEAPTQTKAGGCDVKHFAH